MKKQEKNEKHKKTIIRMNEASKKEEEKKELSLGKVKENKGILKK